MGIMMILDTSPATGSTVSNVGSILERFLMPSTCVIVPQSKSEMLELFQAISIVICCLCQIFEYSGVIVRVVECCLVTGCSTRVGA